MDEAGQRDVRVRGELEGTCGQRAAVRESQVGVVRVYLRERVRWGELERKIRARNLQTTQFSERVTNGHSNRSIGYASSSRGSEG